MSTERRRVHFSGDVQGVGFRWTTRRIAADHPVTGYVQNLPDGRVHCEVEGEAEAIDAFLAAVEDRMAGFIRNVDQQRAPATGGFEGFGIYH